MEKSEKHERIPDEHKLAIVYDYSSNNLTIALFSRKYYLRYSTVCLMIKSSKI